MKTRRRHGENPHDFSGDDLGPEIVADGSTDFEAGLPPTGGGRRSVSKRDAITIDDRPPPGSRHLDVANFDAEFPPIAIAKTAPTPAPPPTPQVAPPEVSHRQDTLKRSGITRQEFAKRAETVPAVLTWAAVRKGTIPALGDPGLPPSLARDVPPEFRYWKAASIEDAQRIRCALVESGIFNADTIRKVNGELRRVAVETFVKMYLSPEYADDAPPVVPPIVRPVEKAAALLKDEARIATLFGEDVTEAVGIETIMTKARALRGDWIVAAKDTPEVRKSIAGPAFCLRSRDDLIFATNADLEDPSAVDWVTGDRSDEVIKFALAEGRTIPLLKAEDDAEERMVFGVVLEPDEVDAQGDTIDAETIRKAAHKFMEEFGTLGVQHREFVNGRLKLLESFIAPAAFTVAKEKVKAGTWLMRQRVVDDALWKDTKAGKFTGFSIGGSAVRKPDKAAAAKKPKT